MTDTMRVSDGKGKRPRSTQNKPHHKLRCCIFTGLAKIAYEMSLFGNVSRVFWV